MSENLTSRIKIGFTKDEKEKHETWARAHKISFADLVRLAIPFYERFNGENPITGNDDKIGKLLEKEEQKYEALLARIEEKIAQFQPINQVPTKDRAKQMEVIENIVRSHLEGVPTGVIVSITKPLSWSREDVTEILLELKSANKIKRVKENWSVV